LIASCANSSPVEIEKTTDDSTKIEEPENLKPIVVGAEQMDKYISFINKGKRVGIVANPSSMIHNTHLVDALMASRVLIKRVFSPEHGFRGDADAGEHVKSDRDKRTGLPIVSLYGKNKKPSNEQLKDIDVMLFDIQDVGVRFYTYISTLHYVMEACAENNIPLIILDRPNPNGHYVDGPVLDMKFNSFVGMHPVPIVHGMTIGEYGQMINGEFWLKDSLQCELTVVSCQNYTHNTLYSLPIPPSPNLRSDVSIQLYPSLCLLEATTVTIGRGTDGPFERYGHPKFPKTEFSFIPKSGFGSKHPKSEGELCNGYDLNKPKYKRINQLDLSFVINANELLEGEIFINRSKFFNLLAGNDILLEQIKEGISQEGIRESWKEGLKAFSLNREKYLIYE